MPGHGDTWSDRVLREFLEKFKRHTVVVESWGDVTPTELVDARTVGCHRVEIRLRAPWIDGVFGVRLDDTMALSEDYISSHGGPLATADVDALVQDMIHLMADEPFVEGDVLEVDSEGVTWRRIDTVT